MNVRRGLFRVWLVLSALFVLAVGFASYSEVRDEFIAGGPSDWFEQFATVVPVRCEDARGIETRDYSTGQDGLCWYAMDKVRLLYPEYKELENAALTEKLHAKAGRPLIPRRPWNLLAEKVVLALGIPLAVLVLGWSLLWAWAAFRGSPPAVSS